MSLTYTVGIKNQEKDQWKTMKVVGHRLNTEIPGSARLALSLPDGSAIIIPEFEKKYFKLFPDFVVRNEYAKRLKDESRSPLKEESYHGELPTE